MYWMNNFTGELLTYEEALVQFSENYDELEAENIYDFLQVFSLTSCAIVP